MSTQIERLASWPDKDAPGEFLIKCSCGRWEFRGTVEQIDAASRSHDDSPWRNHIVSIVGRLISR